MMGLRALPRTTWVLRDAHCDACKLCSTEGNVCIMGRGSSRWGGVMFIGEAPGATEAETGMPFMGVAGQLLNRYIRQVGLQRNSYITNVCKCRPPSNRRPQQGEIDTCSRLYLRHEIDYIKPVVIVLLGKTAIDLVFQGEQYVKHGENVGRGDEMFGFVWCVPTWHPAYCLRNGNEFKNGRRRSTYQQLLDSIYLAKELMNR